MPNLSLDFSDRVIVITGAARGIGFELARMFSNAGGRVVVVDRDADETALAAAHIGARPEVVDVSSTAQVEEALSRVVAEEGQLDIVVNNAGILRDAWLWKLSDEDWDQVLAVHLGGTFRFIRGAVPYMRARGYGRIVNVTSYTGLHGNVGQANYAAAKAGIIGLTKTAAKELAGFGITVNAISPNAETRMIDSIPDTRRKEIEQAIPLGRFAKPSEMAAAVAYLASDEAAYVTGVVLPVDGGISM
jgi:3-oxoacyl-[acyl-carrier protein] reductase